MQTTALTLACVWALRPEIGGPRLELEGLEGLEGLELQSDTATATATGTATHSLEARPTGGGSIEKSEARGDPFTTLAERAAAIIDRTTIGGYGEHDFSAGPGQIARFRNHRYVIFLHSEITDRISTATEVEFEFAGSPLKKDGVLGHGEVLLEFSVVDFRFADWLIFRAGVLLVPVGALNLRHDSPTQDLTDRPIAYTTIVPSTWFETGAGFHGAFSLESLGQRWTYELYVVNGLDARIVDGHGLRAARGSHFEDNNHDKAIVGRVAYSPTLGFELGLSGYTGEYDLRGNRVNLANLDLTWRLGKLELLGEAALAAIDEGFIEGFSPSSEANTRDPVPTSMAGFTTQANFHFIVPPLWDVFPDWLKEATFTGVLRYEGKDTDRKNFSAAGDQRRLTLGLNFRPIEAYVLKTDLTLDARGTDQARSAPEIWEGRFWEHLEPGFLTSVAFLF